MRFIGFFFILAIIGAAGFVYDVKYQTTRLSHKAADLQQAIDRENDAIAALRAEWSALNQPARLQVLAERHLPAYRNLSVGQMALPYELPERPLDLGKFIDGLDGQAGKTPPEKPSETAAIQIAGAAPVPLARPAPQIIKAREMASPRAQPVRAPMALTPAFIR